MPMSSRFDVSCPQFLLVCCLLIQFQLNPRKSTTIFRPTVSFRVCCKYTLKIKQVHWIQRSQKWQKKKRDFRLSVLQWKGSPWPRTLTRCYMGGWLFTAQSLWHRHSSSLFVRVCVCVHNSAATSVQCRLTPDLVCVFTLYTISVNHHAAPH